MLRGRSSAGTCYSVLCHSGAAGKLHRETVRNLPGLTIKLHAQVRLRNKKGEIVARMEPEAFWGRAGCLHDKSVT